MMRHTLLYIDDEIDNLNVFQSLFRHDYNVIVADSARKGINFLRQTKVDLIISDFKMPEINGVDFLVEMMKEFPDINRILLTAFHDSEVIIKSINSAHIYSYITKPWKKEELHLTIKNALVNSDLKKSNADLIENLSKSNEELLKANAEVSKLKALLEEENSYLRKEIDEVKSTDLIVGDSTSLKTVKSKIEQVAKLSTTVLIQGETGTGKELVARLVHKLSSRNNKPFVKLNCASLPSALVESELFGYEKGAFTGANQNKAGLFEIANGGTIFLDEIGEMPIDVQPKLLRVLQEGEFYKIGSSKPSVVSVRIIAATNRVLETSVSKGEFRSDLFYRLNVFPILVPPLRDRLEDIPMLVEYLVDKYKRRLGIDITKIPQKSIDFLMKHDWPGNIRELEATIERSMITSEGGALIISEINSLVTVPKVVESDRILSLNDMEKEYITKILTKTSWKISGKDGAADLLKLNHNTLRSKMIKLGIKFK